MEQIKDKLPKTPQGQVEPEEEILTQEEIQHTLRLAREEKRRLLRVQEYEKKVFQEKEQLKIDPKKLYQWIVRQAEDQIQNFALSKEEEKIYKMLSLYFTGSSGFEKYGEGFSLQKGIFLWGRVGCGKSSIMKIFMDNPLQSFGVISVRRVADIYKEQGSDVVYRYSQVKSICFDDLGTEIEEGVKSHFGNKKNVMADIILNYYDNNSTKNFKMHFTTNLDFDEIEKEYGIRVRSRLREMCNVISLEGINDKRK
jgi:hypothetical protein